jgi:DNA-binding Lrp family transcriptional regulator
VRLPYRKSLIASRIGIAPESLSRAMARLVELGVKSRGDEVAIEDVKKLRRFCRT